MDTITNLPEQTDDIALATEQLAQADKAALAELDKIIEQSVPPTEKIHFDKDDVAILIELWEQGHTVKEIASFMGRSYNNVRNKVASLQKKGTLRTRNSLSDIPANFAETTAGLFNLPVDTVEHLSHLIKGNDSQIMAMTHMLCAAYVQQKGYCYYLKERIKLTMDNTPSGVEIVDVKGQPVLVCKAVAGMRMAISHHAFVNICKYIAQTAEV